MNLFKESLKKFLKIFGYQISRNSEILESNLPVNYGTASLVPRSPADFDSDLEYAISVGENYVKDINEADLNIAGKEILEIGPGINFGCALILLWNGAETVTVIDKYLAKFVAGYHDKFYHDLRVRYFERNFEKFDSNIENLMTYQNLLNNDKLIARECGLENITDSTFDITLSCAVLEHVENPKSSVNNLFLITRKNGFGSHQVDFRDHRNFEKPLEYLLLDEMSFFELFESVHGECGNRTRSFQWTSLIKEFFGDRATIVPNMWVEEPYFNDFILRLSKSNMSNFSKYDPDELKVLSGKIKFVK
jgi:hypothetical protein